MCRTNIRTGALLTRLLPWNWLDPAAPVKTLIRRYDGWLDGRRLTNLPEQPDFVFCATDMAYGVNWTFARDRVGSYQAGHVSPVLTDHRRRGFSRRNAESTEGWGRPAGRTAQRHGRLRIVGVSIAKTDHCLRQTIVK